MSIRYFFDHDTGIGMMVPDTTLLCEITPLGMQEISREEYYERMDRETMRKDMEREVYRRLDEEDRQ